MLRLHDCIAMMDQGIARTAELVPNASLEHARLARLLLLVGTILRENFERRLKPYNLNDSEFMTLMILFSDPRGYSTPGELCLYTAQGAANMTRIANTLVKRGLIERTTGETDRRRVAIRATAAGRRYVKQMIPSIISPKSLLFTGFSDTEMQTFSRLLHKLATNLDQLQETQDTKAATP